PVTAGVAGEPDDLLVQRSGEFNHGAWPDCPVLATGQRRPRSFGTAAGADLTVGKACNGMILARKTRPRQATLECWHYVCQKTVPLKLIELRHARFPSRGPTSRAFPAASRHRADRRRTELQASGLCRAEKRDRLHGHLREP